jgi:hypothetical protein
MYTRNYVISFATLRKQPAVGCVNIEIILTFSCASAIAVTPFILKMNEKKIPS